MVTLIVILVLLIAGILFLLNFRNISLLIGATVWTVVMIFLPQFMAFYLSRGILGFYIAYIVALVSSFLLLLLISALSFGRELSRIGNFYFGAGLLASLVFLAMNLIRK